MEAVFFPTFYYLNYGANGIILSNASVRCPGGIRYPQHRRDNEVSADLTASVIINPGEKLQPYSLIVIRSNGFASLPGCFYVNCICLFL
jgi:hypothetical protein